MKHLYSIFILFIVFSCDSSRLYEDYVDMDESFWHMDSVQYFSFTVEETDLQYNILATFRNASSYPFYNLYFQYSILDSSRQIVKQELKEVNFFDPKTGEPYGSGLGDLFDHRVPLEEQFTFAHEGNYTIALQQFMRMDTLPFILSVGARVEFSE